MARSSPDPRPETADPVGAFETSMQELESIVQSLEQGELKLDESLRLYERGMKLAQQCRQALQNAELKIQELGSSSSEESA